MASKLLAASKLRAMTCNLKARKKPGSDGLQPTSGLQPKSNDLQPKRNRNLVAMAPNLLAASKLRAMTCNLKSKGT